MLRKRNHTGKKTGETSPPDDSALSPSKANPLHELEPDDTAVGAGPEPRTLAELAGKADKAVAERIQRPVRLPKFGKHLKNLRLQAGLARQEDAVAAMKEYGHSLSRSALSLYEQGRMTDVDAATLHAIEGTYHVSYDYLISQLTAEKYGVDCFGAGGLKPLGYAKIEVKEPGEVMLLGRVKMISLRRLEQEQRSLTASSTVYVSADDFLDNEYFVEMVRYNLRKGVRYQYLLPEARLSELQDLKREFQESGPDS